MNNLKDQLGLGGAHGKTSQELSRNYSQRTRGCWPLSSRGVALAQRWSCTFQSSSSITKCIFKKLFNEFIEKHIERRRGWRNLCIARLESQEAVHLTPKYVFGMCENTLSFSFSSIKRQAGAKTLGCFISNWENIIINAITAWVPAYILFCRSGWSWTQNVSRRKLKKPTPTQQSTFSATQEHEHNPKPTFFEWNFYFSLLQWASYWQLPRP